MKEQIPLIYLCIHKRLEDKFQNEAFKLKDLFLIFARTYHINKKFHYAVLKELESLKLMQRLNQHTARVLKCSVDLENTSRIYKKVGLY
ncbi:hypothetical protein LCGC14_0509610 [marine sediment metagenome]|uniref:Uncharacterized protein n=1 Tax=marine sediment metagenome TaxID=412755 RepID=A0A0F9S1S1_9ZZZZ